MWCFNKTSCVLAGMITCLFITSKDSSSQSIPSGSIDAKPTSSSTSIDSVKYGIPGYDSRFAFRIKLVNSLSGLYFDLDVESKSGTFGFKVVDDMWTHQYWKLT